MQTAHMWKKWINQSKNEQMSKQRIFQRKYCYYCLVTKLYVTHLWPQIPLSMGFPRQEYWSVLSFPSSGDLSNSEILHCRWIHDPWATMESQRRHTNGKKKKKIKTCLISPIIRGTQINYNGISLHTFHNGHHIKSTSNKCRLEYGEKGSLLQSAWECKLMLSVWRRVCRFLKKKLKREVPCDPAIPLLAYIWRKTCFRRIQAPSMFTLTLFTVAKTWKQPKCLSIDEWIKIWHL